MIRAGVRRAGGFTLIEVMIALTLGILVVLGIVAIFVAMKQIYSSSHAQSSIQNADNAISAIISPAVRGAGFGGCGTLTKASVNLISGPGPLVNNYQLAVQGYDATGTPGTVSGTGANTVTITADNAANDATASHWTPAMDASFGSAGIAAEPGNDVLVLSGEMPGTAPAGVNSIDPTADHFVVTDNSVSNVVSTLSNVGLPTPGSISDCGKSAVFMITGQSGAGSAVTITHGAGAPGNTSSLLPVKFPLGSQFVPLQQQAFYVAQGAGGQSALYRATLVGGAWVGTPIVPGVENMQVLYGVNNAGNYRWLPAGAVADWTMVGAVRIGFLIEGALGSNPTGGATTFNVLGTTVTVPTDTRLRHVFEITEQIRNVSL